jgi:dienelactone hydrolase
MPGVATMRSIALAIASLTISTIVCSAAEAQNPSLFQFKAQPGAHPVGLKIVEQYDYSRLYRPAIDDLGKPYTGERARPIQTLIWYPSTKTDAKPMTVDDYVGLQATETSFGHPRPDDLKKTREDMAPSLSSKLWAVRDAPLEKGRFPVVIYAPSFSAPTTENADLCEFLASHGYVVVAGPDMGATTRDMTPDLTGIDAQTRDISFLIGYAQTLPDTDMSEIAVAGYSWGGISNLFAAARDSRIDALVAWDGSMRYYPGLVKRAGDVHPEQLTIPLLYITAGEFTIEDQVRYLKDMDSPNVLNGWTHGDLTTVHMLGMTHGEFSSSNQRNEGFWKYFPEDQKADYGRADGAVGYKWAAQYTLEFLDAYLKHDAMALAFLKKTPAENGAPQHFLSASYRPAKGSPSTLDAFRAELGRQGFDHTAQVYAAMHKDNPDFKLEEGAINSWASQLISENHLPEATELLKLNVQLNPGSASAYDSLGEAYTKSGQKELAIESYRKSLEKNPDNINARDKLKQLQSGEAAKN